MKITGSSCFTDNSNCHDLEARESGKPAIGFLAGSIKEYETLPKLVETFGTAFNGDGKYFIYIADLPRGNRFYIRLGDVKIFVIFIDETTVYNELIDTFYVDKVKLKKFDTPAKLDALADVGLQYSSLSDYAEISFEDGLKRKNAASCSIPVPIIRQLRRWPRLPRPIPSPW